MPRTAIASVDPELVPALTRDALSGLDRMLTAMPPTDTLPANEVGALMRVLSLVAAAEPPKRRASGG
jgi:hypothetical protein